MKQRNTVITVLIVIVAIVIAWWLVGVLLSAVWLLVRLAIVAVVAVLLYTWIKNALDRSDRSEK